MPKPITIELPEGEKYSVMVLEVIESDGKGARLFRRVHEDEKVKVKDNMQFWIVYANQKMLEEKPN